MLAAHPTIYACWIGILALSNGEVIILVVLIAAPIAAVAFMGAGGVYRQIGKGPFAIDREDPSETAESTPEQERAVRDEELRQLLEAKAYRQRERGETPIDVDAEIDRLAAQAPAPAVDPGLEEEVRQMIVASNERRIRRGKEPLDVEAEVTRRLREI